MAPHGDFGRSPSAPPRPVARIPRHAGFAFGGVLCLPAEASDTSVVTVAGEALVRKPIKELRAHLDPETFWPIHGGAIVNRGAIARVDRDWRSEPVIAIEVRKKTLAVRRTFAHRFKAR